MNEAELEEVLAGLNSALKVFHVEERQNTLSAVEIRLKSLLMVIHSQVAEQLQEMRAGSKPARTTGSNSPWGVFSQPQLPGFPRLSEP